MKELTPQAIIVEQMNGFRPVVEEMRSKFGCELIYGDLGELIDGNKENSQVIGIVKGPRSKLTPEILLKIANAMHNPVIAYIGRHPEKILDEGVDYDLHHTKKQTKLLIHTESGNIPMIPIKDSPLSSAVASFVVGSSRAIIDGELDDIKSLTIHSGNTFDRRLGHSFKEDDVVNDKTFQDRNVAVIGAGDIGSKVINLFDKAGAQVYYTSLTQKTLGSDNVRFVPSTGELLELSEVVGNFSIVTVHVPPGVKVPLDSISGVGIFINTSSGSNIDEEELITALNEGRIQHAIVDVFKFEGKDFHRNRLSRLVNDGKLTLTSHIAYNEPQAIRKTLEMAMQNLMLYRNSRQNI